MHKKLQTTFNSGRCNNIYHIRFRRLQMPILPSTQRQFRAIIHTRCTNGDYFNVSEKESYSLNSSKKYEIASRSVNSKGP